jgi:hypothetical protein
MRGRRQSEVRQAAPTTFAQARSDDSGGWRPTPHAGARLTHAGGVRCDLEPSVRAWQHPGNTPPYASDASTNPRYLDDPDAPVSILRACARLRPCGLHPKVGAQPALIGCGSARKGPDPLILERRLEQRRCCSEPRQPPSSVRAKRVRSEVRARVWQIDTLAPARKAGASSATARTTACRPSQQSRRSSPTRSHR